MYIPDISHQVWLSLGSNLGKREASLDQACELLGERSGEIVSRSGMYESEAWGFESRNAFLNCCLELRTGLGPEDLMKAVLQIEEELGRMRSDSGYADRAIDIDILFFDDLVINLPDLVLPHPRLADRRFVLLPLVEIAPLLAHPLSGLSMEQVLEACPDRSQIRRL